MPNFAVSGALLSSIFSLVKLNGSLKRAHFASSGICVGIFIHLGCSNLGLVTIPIISAIRFNRIYVTAKIRAHPVQLVYHVS